MEAFDLDREREQLLIKNAQKLKELGLAAAAAECKAAIAAEAAAARPPRPPKQAKPKRAEPEGPREIRRSQRARAEVSYNEDAAFREAGPSSSRGEGGSKRARTQHLTEDEIEAVRALHGAKSNGEEGGTGAGGPRDSGKGLRRQGGKWYDSKTGVTCHWCRQKTISLKVTCTNPECGHRGSRGGMCMSFCEGCLRNRNGEDAAEAAASGTWVCPRCRGSCGEGCVVCCNCGPCRKRAGLEPTGQIMPIVLRAGYNNVHDYLVGKATGKTQEQLTQRKLQQPWAAWMRQEQPQQEEKQEEDEEEKQQAPGGGNTVGDDAMEEGEGDEEEEEPQEEGDEEEQEPQQASGEHNAVGDDAVEEEEEEEEPQKEGDEEEKEEPQDEEEESQKEVGDADQEAAVAAAAPALEDGLVEQQGQCDNESSGSEEDNGRPKRKACRAKAAGRQAAAATASAGKARLELAANKTRGRKAAGRKAAAA